MQVDNVMDDVTEQDMAEDKVLGAKQPEDKVEWQLRVQNAELSTRIGNMSAQLSAAAHAREQLVEEIKFLRQLAMNLSVRGKK